MYGLAFNASLPIIYFNEQLVHAGGGDPDQDARHLGPHDRARREDQGHGT